MSPSWYFQNSMDPEGKESELHKVIYSCPRRLQCSVSGWVVFSTFKEIHISLTEAGGFMTFTPLHPGSLGLSPSGRKKFNGVEISLMPLTQQDTGKKKHSQKLAKASQKRCAKQSKTRAKDHLYLPSAGKEGSMEGERPGQPLTKEAGELEAADLLLADTGAP